ncbi:FixH family protein [uncultured Tateyamaria sp.]|uniref:FixH family protein n=1 Tax=uncultured Tateyamaria sp. TaxID=455651 RepID=UPI003453550E
MFSRELTGWHVAAIFGGAFAVIIGAVVPGITAATLGRATHVADDRSPVFYDEGARFAAEVGTLARGNWNLRIAAEADDGTAFRQRVFVRVAPRPWPHSPDALPLALPLNGWRHRRECPRMS